MENLGYLLWGFSTAHIMPQIAIELDWIATQIYIHVTLAIVRIAMIGSSDCSWIELQFMCFFTIFKSAITMLSWWESFSSRAGSMFRLCVRVHKMAPPPAQYGSAFRYLHRGALGCTCTCTCNKLVGPSSAILWLVWSLLLVWYGMICYGSSVKVSPKHSTLLQMAV